jgi:hypothetical protein
MLGPVIRAAACSVLLLMGNYAAASTDPSQFQMGHDIHVAADQTTGDLACFNCSIYIRGKTSGDAFVLNGDVVVEPGGQLAGDVSTLRGDVRVADGGQIGGDVATVAGTVRRQPSALIGGDVAALNGIGWVFLVFLVPLAILGGVIALIVWLVQRNRQPVHVGVRTS